MPVQHGVPSTSLLRQGKLVFQCNGDRFPLRNRCDTVVAAEAGEQFVEFVFTDTVVRIIGTGNL